MLHPKIHQLMYGKKRKEWKEQGKQGHAEHVSKIGVKFRKDNGDKGKMYYSTAYDNEKFDL